MTTERKGPNLRLITVIAAIVLAGVGYFVWTGVDRDDKLDERDQALGATQEFATALDEVCQTIPAAAVKLGSMCAEAAQAAETPEVVITPMPGPTGPAGEQGPAPSAQQIDGAVRAVFARNPEIPEAAVQGAVVSYLEANPPPRGEDARPATPQELEVAVAAFCAGDTCRGEPGVAGTPGEDGDDSTVPGPEGPPPSDEQIAAAVATFCTSDGQCPTDQRIAAAVTDYCAQDADPCRGPAGADGEDSTVPGPAGPACPDGADPVEWTVDRQTELLNGLEPGTYLLCRAVGEQPEPDPTS